MNTCVLAKPQRSSLRIHLCASERFLEFLIVLQLEKVNFFTINVKFKVILSSKGGGGDICTGHPPTQKSGGGGGIHPLYPPPRDLRQ